VSRVALLVLSAIATRDNAARAALTVASAANNSVIRYNTTTGEFIEVLASEGGLDLPIAPIVGADGDFYVSSYNNSQVLRYDGTTGAPKGVFATGPGPFNGTGIRFGPDGNFYFAAFQTGEIRRYDGTTGAFIDVFAQMDENAQPSGLVWGPDGNLYVTQEDVIDEPDGSVFRFNGTTGEFIDVFVPPGSGGLELAAGLTFGPDGNLYVAGFGNDSVLRYDGTSGAFIDQFTSGGGLTSAADVLFGPDNNLYVSGGTNQIPSGAILRYDGSTGAFIDVFASGGGLDGPLFMVFDGKPDVPLPEPAGVVGCFFGLLALVECARRGHRGTSCRVRAAQGNKVPHQTVAEGRKPSGFAVPDGSRRSATSVTYLRTTPRFRYSPIVACAALSITGMAYADPLFHLTDIGPPPVGSIGGLAGHFSTTAPTTIPTPIPMLTGSTKADGSWG
jgi:streptogramin lyase